MDQYVHLFNLLLIINGLYDVICGLLLANGYNSPHIIMYNDNFTKKKELALLQFIVGFIRIFIYTKKIHSIILLSI